jgi:hypothetical protein
MKTKTNCLSNSQVGYLSILTAVPSLKLSENQWRRNPQILGEEISVWDTISQQEIVFFLIGKVNGNLDLLVRVKNPQIEYGDYIFPLDYDQQRGKKLPWIIVKFAKIALASIRG